MKDRDELKDEFGISDGTRLFSHLQKDKTRVSCDSCQLDRCMHVHVYLKLNHDCIHIYASTYSVHTNTCTYCFPQIISCFIQAEREGGAVKQSDFQVRITTFTIHTIKYIRRSVILHSCRECHCNLLSPSLYLQKLMSSRKAAADAGQNNDPTIARGWGKGSSQVQDNVREQRI